MLDNSDISIYTDETTPNAFSNNEDEFIASLKKSFKDVLKLVDKDLIKNNHGKSHLMMISVRHALPPKANSTRTNH